MVTKYKLFEGKGVPDIIKVIINYEIVKYLKNLELNKKYTFKIDLNKYLKDTILTLNIITVKSDKVSYNGNVNYYEIINEGFKNSIINITANVISNIDISEIIQSLYHELTHLYELYNVKDYISKSRWIHQIRYNEFIFNNKNFKMFQYFIDMIYLSFDHEINARVSSLYEYFYSYDSINKDELIEHLKKSKQYRSYLNMENFSYLKLMFSYKDDLTILMNFVRIFNKYNEKNIAINNRKDLINYFKKWKYHFSDSAKKYYIKMLKVIDEVIEDKNKNINRIFEEYNVDGLMVNLPYFTKEDKDYIDNKIKEILSF